MITQLPIGLLGSNCYLVLDAVSKDAAVVDPGFRSIERIREVLKEHDARVCYILNTHGHFDHVAGNGTLAPLAAELGIHPADRALLLGGGGAAMFGLAILPSPVPDLDLVDGCHLALGSATTIAVLHTPGHTPGSVCLYVAEEKSLLTGDTLFRGSVGRTDLPGGSNAALLSSLERIAELPDETRVYPGHGRMTTIAREKVTNPWLRGANATS